ncbi:hypothetical protein [Sphaerimonospora thailandensis]|uniref:Uncharacterized protein n=1 Tax=Sphaerimonospora thailandensis TaxID=795644 RepID=A0A8J3R2I2_9ACTN|nr:hypothetical protein [Sphaerimonospora thailandensis]GIH67837.1 hypothetical protein Mth01_00900 [Sphaerimonospora thailandensis]
MTHASFSVASARATSSPTASSPAANAQPTRPARGALSAAAERMLGILAEAEDKAEAEDEDCPGVSPHPAVPLPGRTAFRWIEESLGQRGRVIEHTCGCVMTVYELISYGGTYQICRCTLPRPGVPAVSWTAERWGRREAYEWWRRLLTGQAR